MKMKEKSNGRRGCVKNRASRTRRFVDETFDDTFDDDEFWTGAVDDGRAFLGTDGDGWILCRVYLFTVH